MPESHDNKGYIGGATEDSEAAGAAQPEARVSAAGGGKGCQQKRGLLPAAPEMGRDTGLSGLSSQAHGVHCGHMPSESPRVQLDCKASKGR